MTPLARRLGAPSVLVEDRLGGDGGGGLLYDAPRRIVRVDDPDGVDDAFASVERGLDAGLHAAGVLSYELGYVLEPKLAPLMPRDRRSPLLWLGLFDAPERIDAVALDRFFASCAPPPPIVLDDDDDGRGDRRTRHAAAVAAAHRLIAAGDIYQVNLTLPIGFRHDGDPLSLYAALRSRQPVAHGGFARLDDGGTVLSVSPELWVAVADGHATVRPMKGTTARGVDPDADAARRDALAADPKQRAENLMIVDLMRNDLARIAETGSVRVPALFTVETYPGFHALTSTVTGRLGRGSSIRDRVTALFPCGSVVGAPKIRAGEIIRALEPTARGIYTGALGAIAPDRDMRFNVAIRTAVVDADGTGRFGVGGGIVADSDAAAEFEETVLKGRVLTDLAREYHLLETFRWSARVGFVRLGSHLDRMAGSARALGFAFDRAAVAATLRAAAESWPAHGADRRIRVALSRSGECAITENALAPAPRTLRVGIVAERLDAGDPFLRHKTTNRDGYERAFDAAIAAGLDEAILLNRRGEVADASRHSVFVSVGNRLVTPPVDGGALPGVLRAMLIDRGAATEAPVPTQLLASRRFWLGNSLRGLRLGVLVGASLA